MPTASFPDRLRPFLLIGLELALVLLVVYRFEIESQRHVFPMLCVAAGGFAVHAWLPRRVRAAFFVLVSAGGILFILGLPNGAAVLGIGLGLIAVCHLPVPVLVRAMLLVLAGGALASWRVDYPAPFWPVLASMFMFRLIIYLFELRHARAHWPSALTLAYFFPLPNACFTLFPVLDYQTFRATYYDGDEYETYQKGIRWIVRGLMHLLAYRVIKFYILPAPYQLHDLPHLALYLAANYALYVRVSGWFHLVTGLLHLFGFNLPRTHDNYFLASSLSDIWRRINIYWKDFMAKVFFFPAFFALRRLGTRAAVTGATLAVFVATWLLHSYQMFWLTGDLPLTRAVALLWLGAGLLVALSLQVDLGEAKATALKRDAGEFRVGAAVTRSLRTLGTFTLVSFFWACWTDPGILKLVQGLWVPASLVENAGRGALGVLALVGIVVVVGVLAQWVRWHWLRDGLPSLGSFQGSVAPHAAFLGVLLLAGVPQVAGVFGSSAEQAAITLMQGNPTLAEANQAMRGYYEEIAETKVQAGAFLGQLSGKDVPPPGDSFHYLAMTRPTDELMGRELIPGWRGTLGSSTLHVNQLGMRDRDDVARIKPPGACRIALVGSSVVMGYGVDDQEVFKQLLEDRLNAAEAQGGRRYELLNFGVGLTHAIHRRTIIEQKVFGFQPDAIYYVAHQDELYGAARNVADLLARGVALPYACLNDAVRKAGVTSALAPEAVEKALYPVSREILVCVYRGLAAECRERRVPLVWIYLPIPGIAEVSVETSVMLGIAREAGFTVVNLADWARDLAPADVKLSAGDHHPNARGHRLIAERLFAELRQRPELLPPARPVEQ